MSHKLYVSHTSFFERRNLFMERESHPFGEREAGHLNSFSQQIKRRNTRLQRSLCFEGTKRPTTDEEETLLLLTPRTLLEEHMLSQFLCKSQDRLSSFLCVSSSLCFVVLLSLRSIV